MPLFKYEVMLEFSELEFKNDRRITMDTLTLISLQSSLKITRKCNSAVY